MAAQEPPTQPPMVPFNMTPTQQNVLFEEETLPDGTKLIKILIVQPYTTTMLVLSQDGARTMADRLFVMANGLQIVRDMPGEGA